jgi:hypothetical protein
VNWDRQWDPAILLTQGEPYVVDLTDVLLGCIFGEHDLVNMARYIRENLSERPYPKELELWISGDAGVPQRKSVETSSLTTNDCIDVSFYLPPFHQQVTL